MQNINSLDYRYGHIVITRTASGFDYRVESDTKYIAISGEFIRDGAIEDHLSLREIIVGNEKYIQWGIGGFPLVVIGYDEPRDIYIFELDDTFG